MDSTDNLSLPGLNEELLKLLDTRSPEWSGILKRSKEYDSKMVKYWQDELANLLTFAGLFSAVVTGFIILTIPKLEADAADESKALLFQISQQLSSFTSSSNIVNSTFQPPSSVAPFVPDAVVVQINALWVSSLTLSLTTALWTISVQQWLRHNPLPRETAVRESIRLRQLRYDGLLRWKVPTIVSLLPIAIQVAVVLFSFGLLLLLNHLDHIVAQTFAGVAGGAFFLLFLTIPIPLVVTGCPYKSPLIPTMLAVVQTVGDIFLSFLRIWVGLYGWVSARLTFRSPTAQPARDDVPPPPTDPERERLRVARELMTLTWDVVRSFILDEVIPTIFLRDINPSTFWVSREVRHVRQPHVRSAIDCSALASVPLILPQTDRRDPLVCLQDLELWDRVHAVAEWACKDLAMTLTDLWLCPPLPLPKVYTTDSISCAILPLVQLRPALFAGLPDWSTVGNTNCARVRQSFVITTSILSLLYRSMLWYDVLENEPLWSLREKDRPFLDMLTAHLVGFHESQMSKEKLRNLIGGVGITPCIWIPTTLLFLCIERSGSHEASPEVRLDPVASISWAHNSIIEVKGHMDDLCYRDLACLLPGMLASVANALNAATKHPNVAQSSGDYNLDRLLLALSSLIDSPRIFRCPALLILASKVDHLNIYFVEQVAIKSITRSLVRLADSRRIGSHQNCPARLVAQSLLEFAELYASERARVGSRASELAQPGGTIAQLEGFVARFPAARPTNRRQTT